MRYHLFCKGVWREEAGEIIRPPKDPAKEARPSTSLRLPPPYLPTWTLSHCSHQHRFCDYGPLQYLTGW